MSNAEIFCTVVIPTIGRDTLDRAVESALDQEFDQAYEVIVVNDSGRPLRAAAWQRAPMVQVIDTQRRERCVARNVGAALAHGRWFNFLDDDDWLLPGALAAFAALAQRSTADWLYGASQLTDAHGRCLFQFDHGINGNGFAQALAGEWVPLQASLISARAFFATGGFDAVFRIVQDKELLLRVALRFDLAGTATPVAGILRGIWPSSTDYSTVRGEWLRACDNILQQPGVPTRLRASAGSAYWHGRWLRVYLASAGWNARRGRLFATLSRLWHASGALLLAGSRLLSGDFWRALTHSHLTTGFEPDAMAHAPSAQPAG